jgi:hypothetical protein
MLDTRHDYTSLHHYQQPINHTVDIENSEITDTTKDKKN